MAHVVDDVFASVEVLGRLVLEDAAMGLFDGHPGEGAVVVEAGHRHLGDDVVDLILVEARELIEGLEAFLDEGVDFRLGGGFRIESLVFFHFCYLLLGKHFV